MRYLYSALLYTLLPFIVLRMLWRSRRAPAYRQHLAQRLAHFDVAARAALATPAPTIWVHAVSVGEVLAAAPLVECLLRDWPDHRLVLTTTTPTGSERVRALFGQRVLHVYAPWDLPGAARRFVQRIQPRLLLIMETELWPNMLHYTHRSGAAIVLANARLSQRSARGYARVAILTRTMLQQIDTVACQAPADGERFLSLGLPPAALQVTGSIKFDLVLDDRQRALAFALRSDFNTDKRPVIVVASTHSGEDEIVLAAFAEVRKTQPDCLLVLVPRHPERFAQVHSLCLAEGWQVVRRSAGEPPGPRTAIVLGDTMGELLVLLGSASVAVIGGSLVPHGGHNMLEAAAWGVPVVTGPYLHNFEQISELLVDVGAMIRLEQPAALGRCLSHLLAAPQRLAQMGAAGRAAVAANAGAQARLLQVVADCLSGER
ncbi:MAG: lipid IV(A) 3-deoxy-D-manno-octulosonic acid transferase [Halioglobus sp.]|nr:lipid IV(A) 3-deoxy-D-manno-octulosonic acid transferase [Halioglobus sp.]